MSKKVKVNIYKGKLKNASKKKKISRLRMQPRKHQRLADCIQSNDLSETAVKPEDVNNCLLNAATSSTAYEEFRNEDQENIDLQHETNVFEKDVEILLDACQTEHSQIQTKAFYCDKIEALHKNHIQELLKENVECEQALKKRNRNKGLIKKRLGAIRKVLCKLKVLNRFSGLKMNRFLKEQNSHINAIYSNLNEFIVCDIKLHANTENIRERSRQTKIKLNAMRRELKDKVNTIQQHSHYAEERNLEINELRVDVNMDGIPLTQTQDNQVCSELIDEMDNEQVKLTPLQAFCKENSASAIEESINMQDENKAKISQLQIQLVGTQQELESVKQSLESKTHTIEQYQEYHSKNILKYFNDDKKDNKVLQNRLAQTREELKAVKKEVDSKAQIVQQKALHDQESIDLGIPTIQKLIKLLNKAEEDKKILKNQLTQTQNELEDFKKGSKEEVRIVQQKLLHEEKEVELLESQLTETQQELEKIKKDLRNKVIIIQQKAQHEQEVKETLNKAEEDKKILKNQLTQTQNELKNFKKGSKEEVYIVQQKLLHEEEEVGLLGSQLTETQQELEKIKKDFRNKKIIIKKKARKVKETLNKAEKDVKVLQSLLAETQQELGICQASNNRVNRSQLEQFEKSMETMFLNIRLMLVKKLGFTNQNCHHFENYMKEGHCRSIKSDILRLIEDKVPSQDKNVTEAVIGSNILKVTEIELHLLILIASILKVVQFSSSIDVIYSFIAEVDNVISRQDVESLLKKFPTLFKEESVGAGSTNKNWRYLYLQPIITI